MHSSTSGLPCRTALVFAAAGIVSVGVLGTESASAEPKDMKKSAAPPAAVNAQVKTKKLRIPKLANPARTVFHKGKTITMKEFVDTADPDEKHVLANGKVVTTQEAFDDVVAFEKALGKNLKDANRRLVVHAGIKGKIEKDGKDTTQSVSALSANTTKLRGVAVRVGRARPRIAERSVDDEVLKGVEVPDVVGGDSWATPKHQDPIADPMGATAAPVPKEEPGEFHWRRSFGLTYLGVDIGLGAGNDFKTLVNQPVMFCGGDAEVDVHLFGQTKQVVDLTMNAWATTKPDFNANLKVFLLGEQTPSWSKSIKKDSDGVSRSVSTQSYSMDVPIWGSVGVRISGQATGYANLAGALSNVSSNTLIPCHGSVVPGAGLKGRVTADLALGGGALEDFVKKYLTLQVVGTADIIAVSAPASFDLSLHTTATADKKPVKLVQSVKLDTEITVLKGVLEGDASLNVPFLAHWLAAAFDLDDFSWKFTIIQSDGWTTKSNLISVSNDEIPFK